MKLTLINPESLGKPKGYNNGVLVRGDCDMLFVAGQVGWDANQRLAAPEFTAQFDRALANVLAVVAAAKGGPEHVVRLTIYVADKSEYVAGLADIGAAYRARMGRHFPAMTLVEVSALLETGAKVEIEATAAIPRPLRRNVALAGLRRRIDAVEKMARIGVIT
jgi:enamine deaminase RidA (YjgF/YER057c/UK114 family)